MPSPPAMGERMIGTIGDIHGFSFYAPKTSLRVKVHGDDREFRVGGAMRIMSLHGISKDAWKRYAARAPGIRKSLPWLQVQLD